MQGGKASCSTSVRILEMAPNISATFPLAMPAAFTARPIMFASKVSLIEVQNSDVEQKMPQLLKPSLIELHYSAQKPNTASLPSSHLL